MSEVQRRPRCRHRTLNCQQIAVGVFVLMTCFQLTSAAPTTTTLSPFLSSSTEVAVEKSTPTIQIALVNADDSRQQSPQSAENSNMKNPIFTTSSPASSDDKVDLLNGKQAATTVSDVTTDNRILIESTESSQHHQHEDATTNVNNVYDEDKNIQQIMTTTIEKPIKLDADNFAIMDEERDANGGVGDKKMRMKESKKKAFKADKKLKLKQKISPDPINHVPATNEPPSDAVVTATAAADVESLLLTTESDSNSDKSTFTAANIRDEVATATSPSLYSPYPTSIKTAPTTIKSTTRTTIKSSDIETATLPFTTMAAASSTKQQENINETTNVKSHQQERNDNVIVLNTNNSGLIVVDIMDSFGAASQSNATETIEIKMDLIDDGSEEAATSTTSKDDIFLTTLELTSSPVAAATTINPTKTAELSTMKSPTTTTTTTIDDGSKSIRIDLDVTTTGANSTPNDDIILINVNTPETLTTPPQIIKWNQVKNGDVNGNIKITFDNVDLPNQNVNVSIENGELVIDSIDIGMLNRAEEALKRKISSSTSLENKSNNNKKSQSDSLEIELIEDDSEINSRRISTQIPHNADDDEKPSNVFQATTIHFDIPKHDRSKKIELSNSGGGGGGENEDGIKIKTTDKDSDTIFYMSNAEVKVIESIPTASPASQSSSDSKNMKNKKYRPAVFEEDVIVDVPSKNRSNGQTQGDKYEEDIILSPLTSPFDPKDINYIGEAFLDVEESQNGVGFSENRHIIPLTSDVVIQPAQLRDFPSPNGIPIIGEIPPQIELEEMVFSDDYENKQMSNLRLEEYFLNSRLVKNSLEADVPKETILDTRNITFYPMNRTHITINTIINGTNMTTISSSLANGTAFLIEKESEEIENADLNEIQTLLVACFATLTPLFLCVIIALTIRYCWRKYHNDDASGHDLTSDKSTDPLAEKHVASTDDLKSAESGMKLDGGTAMGTSTELLLTANGEITTPTNHNGNGSIITMTLKNNHLIVETEERNDLSRDTRETKMHYSPSDKDGVFIVEAARGADQNGSHKPSPLQQKPKEAPLVIPEEIKIDTIQSHFSPSSPEEERKQTKPEQVEVHSPPVDVDLKEKTICNGTKTGLSQSDLSLTSSNSSNQNYSYGDKDTYQCEEKGYKGSSPKRIINIHNHDLKPLIENSPPVTVKKTLDEQPKVHKLNGIIKNGLDEITTVTDENFNDAPPPPLTNGCHSEINMDSLSSFPAPPDDVNNDPSSILELTSMDSLPPPPPEIELAQS